MDLLPPAPPWQQQAGYVSQDPSYAWHSQPMPNAEQLSMMPGLHDVEEQPFQYLNAALEPDVMLSENVIEQLISQAGSRPLDFNARPRGESMPLLHLVVLNTATTAPTQQDLVAKLIQLGAAPDAEDDEGDTALTTLLSLASERIEDDEPLSEDILAAQAGTMELLLTSQTSQMVEEEVKQVCGWLRNHAPTEGNVRQRVLDALIKRFGYSEVIGMWNSEQLLAYLENEAYDGRRSVEAVKVLDFLAKGASPRHSQNGATALSLVILNPHNTYEEVLPIFHAMLEKDPYCATLKDGFKLCPFQWAVDFRNISSQHGLKKPNPACLLAILPSIVEKLPADADAGEVCISSQATNRTYAQVHTRPHTQLRFTEGDEVLCRVQSPGGITWEEGTVVDVWYREDCWPDNHPGAPYEVKLLIGLSVFALVDHDRIIRRPKAKRDVPSTHSSNSKKGGRFQRRQKDDGSWELLDTVSGKAKQLPSDFEPSSDSD